jgi:hypothetical protein
MGISKTEVNLRRLLAAAPNQQNQTKLIHVRLNQFLNLISKFHSFQLIKLQQSGQQFVAFLAC